MRKNLNLYYFTVFFFLHYYIDQKSHDCEHPELCIHYFFHFYYYKKIRNSLLARHKPSIFTTWDNVL